MSEAEDLKVINKFLVTLKKCLYEYRRLQAETRGTDEDVVHFFDPALKTWAIKNKYPIVGILGSMNFERPFVLFIRNYLTIDRKEPYQQSLMSKINIAGEKAAQEDCDKAVLKVIDKLVPVPSDIVRQEAANYKADVINGNVDSKFMDDTTKPQQPIGQPQIKSRGLL